MITLVHSKYDKNDDACWLPESDTNLSEKDFELFKGMLEHFEQAYQLGIYKPVQEE